MSKANFSFQAHPPSSNAFEEFHTDSPAFMLAKVDGDELVHLLESQPGTPFETPRLNDHVDDSNISPVLGNKYSEFSKSRMENRKKTKELGPQPIYDRPDALEPPKQAHDDFQVPVPRSGHELSNPTSQDDEGESDAHLIGAWQEYKGFKWSVNDAKILYLVSSLTSICIEPIDSGNGQLWVREAHFLVFLFQGIQNGIFNLRTAPSPIILPKDGDPRWEWWNLPSGWKICIQELCRAKYLLCLRLVDLNFTQSTAFQVTDLAIPFIQIMPDALKDEINALLLGPTPYEGEFVNINILENNAPRICTKSGYERLSIINEIESISFITSPYVPLFLRFTDQACTDNAALAPKCAAWNDFPSAHRVECMCFGNVTICVSEYLPLGPNMIQSVSETLGCREKSLTGPRGKYGFLLQQRRKTNSKKSYFTKASVLDWNFVSQINYEASIHEMKHHGNVKRLDDIGVHVNQDGTVLCGVQIEAVSDKEWDDISPELLVKILYQIQKDSTIVVDNIYPDILYQYLDCVFFGEESRRIKFACLIADLLEPKLPAKQYLDKGQYENEVSWMVGEIHIAEDLGDTDLLMIGSRGLLLVGANARDHELLATKFSVLMGRKIFLDQLFKRASCLSNLLSGMYHLLLQTEEDQSRLNSLNESLLKASSDLKKLNSVLTHFQSSVNSVDKIDIPNSLLGRKLFDLLRLSEMPGEQLDRARDLEIIMSRIKEDLSCLMELSSFEERKNVARCFSSLQRQTLHLAREKGAVISHSGALVLGDGCAMRMLMICFSGLLASCLLDRINSGALTNTGAPSWFVNMLDGTVNSQPFLLFIIQTTLILVFCAIIHRRSWLNEQRSVCFVRRKLTLNIKIIDLMALFRYLDNVGCENVLFRAKVIEIDNYKSRIRGEDGLLTVTYLESQNFKWFGDAPRVKLEIDVVHGWIKTAEYSWDFWADAQTKVDLEAHIRKVLVDSGAVHHRKI